MNSGKMAMVLIALLAVGALGGITIGIAESTDGVRVQGWGLIHECDGDDPPPDPNGIPSGDPEHPQ